MVRAGPAQPAPPPKEAEIPARSARGGEIILRSPASRAVFVIGLVLVVLIAVGIDLWH